MIRIIIALTALSVMSLVQAEDSATPPKMWEAGLRNQRQVVWDQLRKDDGKVSASEIIEWMYKNHLSHHDGDSQKYAAFCLIQLDDDPLQHLRKMMAEEQPTRRAYAALIAGMLGDTRLTEDIKRLADDNAKLGQFEGDWFWNTVADIAKEASRSMADGGITATLRAKGVSVAAWVPRTKPKAECSDGKPPEAAQPPDNLNPNTRLP
jgi:hypothetical protein